MVKVSPAGVVKIRQREGCKLRAYRDSVGVLTIGVGHTGRMSGPKVTPGMVITQARADALLAGDLAPVEAAITAAVLVPLSQNQVDALASLAFNIGVNGFKGSTVVHKLNAGDVAGAADAFLMWEKPAALKARREAERAQFLTPDASVAAHPLTTTAVVDHKMPKVIDKDPVGPAAAIIGPTPTVPTPRSDAPMGCGRPDCPLRAAKAA